MRKSNYANAKRLSLNGILLALTVITLFFATTMPTSRLALYALSSFFVAVLVIEYGIKNAWAFFIASCLLTLIIIPNKLGLVPYVLFFGSYGIAKYYIERIGKLLPEYLLKLLYFNSAVAIAFYLVRYFFMYGINLALNMWIVIAILQIAFVIYDFVYTLFIQYYNSRLKKILKL